MTAMGHAAIVVAERKALLARTDSLVREFHPVLSAGAVIRAVTRCRAELLRAGVRRGLASTTEARVRAQLCRSAASADRIGGSRDSRVAGLAPPADQPVERTRSRQPVWGAPGQVTVPQAAASRATPAAARRAQPSAARTAGRAGRRCTR